MSATGLVVVDKEAGWTSHDVVAQCRRIFGQRGEQLPGRARQPGECRCGRSGSERQKPGALHTDAFAHQASLAEQIADRRQFARVSAVEG